MVLADPAPLRFFNGDLSVMVEMMRNNYMPLDELAQEELRLAGVRFSPDTFCSSRQAGFRSVKFVHLNDPCDECEEGENPHACKRSGAAVICPNPKYLKEVEVTGLPADNVIRFYSWAPDYQTMMLFVKEEDGLYLYAVSPDDGLAHRITSRRMQAIERTRIHWTSAHSFLMEVVPDDMPGRHLPMCRRMPKGPMVQESGGEKSVATRTYQDMLRNEYDEQLFDYYFTSQLMHIHLDGSEEKLGVPAIYENISLSPDHRHILVSTIHRPYSHRVGKHHFPQELNILDLQGRVEHHVLSQQSDIAPIGLDTCVVGPRSFAWRTDQPATLTWMEAQDGGNPKLNPGAPCADAVYQLSAPFDGVSDLLVETEYRCCGLHWCDDRMMVVGERSRAKRLSRLSVLSNASASSRESRVFGKLIPLFEWNSQDKYSDPGQIVTVPGPYGEDIVYTDPLHKTLLMRSNGASREGERPLLYRYYLDSGEREVLWQSRPPYYEQIVAMCLTGNGEKQYVTSRQSVSMPQNLFLHSIDSYKRPRLITYTTNPYRVMRGVSRQLIHYKRRDGIDLTATVYLPKDYDPCRDGRLPVLMWAYPKEFKSADCASQVNGSPYLFSSIRYSSPIFWVTQGYCIMDHVDMPIVGSKDCEPNDTYLEQLTMNAEAAVNAIVDMGVGDRERIAIGGHSYGAFMVANLLTHTRLFRAGIARSGAYNRTLTPFGFQSEVRSYWDAPDIYNAMSPFMHADQFSGGLLLVHGELDNNPGTFTMQSERYYQALSGNHADVRYVCLPYEGHTYVARENVLHLLYEQHQWLESHLKVQVLPKIERTTDTQGISEAQVS